MDMFKIGPGPIQYTPVDGCTRIAVLQLYSRRTAANTLDFIDWLWKKCRFLYSDSRRTGVENFSQRKFKER